MDPLREMFRYHAWATLTLIDHCAELAPERLRESAPGTYGPVLPTLVHLVAAEQRYLEGMTGEAADSPVREGMELTLAELRERFEAHVPRWEALVDRAGELDVTLSGRGRYPDIPHAEDLVFLQAIHHGNDHRTHVCSVLGVLGLEVPDIDGWAYWQATRTPDA